MAAADGSEREGTAKSFEKSEGKAKKNKKEGRERGKNPEGKFIRWKSLALSVDNSNFITGAWDYDLTRDVVDG